MTTSVNPSRPAMRTSMRRYVASVGAVVVGALVVGGGILAATWSRIPDVVATHWGTHGVDRTQAKPTAYLSLMLLMLGLAALFGVMARFIHPDGRRYLAAATGFVVGLISVLVVGSMVAQIGLTDPTQAVVPPLVIVMAVVVSIGLAVLLWWLNPPPEFGARRRDEPLPEDAVTLAHRPGERLVWIGHTAPLHWGGLTALGLVLLATVIVCWVASPWLVLVPLAVAVLVVGTINARVVVDAGGVRVSSGPVTWIRLGLDQIQSAGSRPVRPFKEYGGLGLRYSSSGRGYVTRKGDGLELRLADGSTAVITMDHAAQAAAVVNTLLDTSD